VGGIGELIRLLTSEVILDHAMWILTSSECSMDELKQHLQQHEVFLLSKPKELIDRLEHAYDNVRLA
jgi:hypothetical protein